MVVLYAVLTALLIWVVIRSIVRVYLSYLFIENPEDGDIIRNLFIKPNKYFSISDLVSEITSIRAVHLLENIDPETLPSVEDITAVRNNIIDMLYSQGLSADINITSVIRLFIDEENFKDVIDLLPEISDSDLKEVGALYRDCRQIAVAEFNKRSNKGMKEWYIDSPVVCKLVRDLYRIDLRDRVDMLNYLDKH